MIGNIILGWFFVGGCVLVVLDLVGVLQVRHHSRASLHLAVLFAVVAWPVFAVKLALHPRWTVRAIRRNLWGRS